MGKKIRVKIKRKMAPETTYDGSELTDLSPRDPCTHDNIRNAVKTAYYVGKEMSGRHFPIMDKQTDRHVATLSKRSGVWAYKILPGNAGADGKLHQIGSKRDTARAAMARICGFDLKGESA
jgi:hypothetical protein